MNQNYDFSAVMPNVMTTLLQAAVDSKRFIVVHSGFLTNGAPPEALFGAVQAHLPEMKLDRVVDKEGKNMIFFEMTRAE